MRPDRPRRRSHQAEIGKVQPVRRAVGDPGLQILHRHLPETEEAATGQIGLCAGIAVGRAVRASDTVRGIDTGDDVRGARHIDRRQSAAAVAGTAPYRVSLAQNVSSGSDLDGSALPTVTTANQYDAFGNATQVVVSTPDGFSKTTTNVFTNDTTNWYLGRLVGASVTSVAP